MITLEDRQAVAAAALIELDVELTRLSVDVRKGDVFERELARARIDVLLDRRLKLSGRRTDAVEGSSPAGDPEVSS